MFGFDVVAECLGVDWGIVRSNAYVAPIALAVCALVDDLVIWVVIFSGFVCVVDECIKKEALLRVFGVAESFAL